MSDFGYQRLEFGEDRESSPSIDRLEPADGYVVGMFPGFQISQHFEIGFDL